MTLTLTHGERTTTVGLIRDINAIGERYTVPTSRMRAALRRIGAHQTTDVSHDATEVWPYFGGYFVSFERR